MGIEIYLIIALLLAIILAINKMITILDNIGGILHLLAFHQDELQSGEFFCEHAHDEDADSPEYDSYSVDEENDTKEIPEPKQSDELWEDWN
nr:hypothetical protein [uncultured Mediterranean phage uvMED]